MINWYKLTTLDEINTTDKVQIDVGMIDNLVARVFISNYVGESLTDVLPALAVVTYDKVNMPVQAEGVTYVEWFERYATKTVDGEVWLGVKND